jgi:dGTPase
MKEAYKTCAKISFNRIYRSKEVLDVELAGFQIISTLLDIMVNAVMNPENEYSKLLIGRVSSQYEIAATDTYTKILAVLDYISGMTDVYALDVYRKINGNSLPAV